jgi:hypothetical protein
MLCATLGELHGGLGLCTWVQSLNMRLACALAGTSMWGTGACLSLSLPLLLHSWLQQPQNMPILQSAGRFRCLLQCPTPWPSLQLSHGSPSSASMFVSPLCPASQRLLCEACLSVARHTSPDDHAYAAPVSGHTIICGVPVQPHSCHVALSAKCGPALSSRGGQCRVPCIYILWYSVAYSALDLI